jgi:hypothetical protein
MIRTSLEMDRKDENSSGGGKYVENRSVDLSGDLLPDYTA